MTLKLKYCFPVPFVFMVILLIYNQNLNARNLSDANGAKTTKVLRAGAATGNITPYLGGGIIGGWSLPPAFREIVAKLLELLAKTK